ncbi:TPA: hypothetical protein I7704_22175 [Vibrio vulnificus]|nr:hypothetical protein [Vibrio vulnificus]HAS8367132.1 hypothetical protein [Vibrio vulnificus]
MVLDVCLRDAFA